MERQRPRVTMQEVADQAQVSIATVSRVLSGTRGNVALETTRKVWKIACGLGYQPCKSAMHVTVQDQSENSAHPSEGNG